MPHTNEESWSKELERRIHEKAFLLKYRGAIDLDTGALVKEEDCKEILKDVFTPPVER